MKFNESHLAQPVNLGIIENVKSYWANHFYSLLQCLNHQKNLPLSPKSLPMYPIWTLSDLRGNLPSNFFQLIQAQIRNHGFQYFLTNFLNQKMASNMVDILIERISYIHEIKFNNELKKYEFFMAGSDSSLSEGLDTRFIEVFPYGTMSEKNDVIKRSDICLVLTNPNTNGKVGIFGEVEGNYGNDQLHSRYWENRSKLSVFSIGISKGAGKKCHILNNSNNGIERVHLHFEHEHHVVVDFLQTIDFLYQAFLNGPCKRIKYQDYEFSYFVDIILKNWNTPIKDILIIISMHIDFSDLVGELNTSIPFILDIQA